MTAICIGLRMVAFTYIEMKAVKHGQRRQDRRAVAELPEPTRKLLSELTVEDAKALEAGMPLVAP